VTDQHDRGPGGVPGVDPSQPGSTGSDDPQPSAVLSMFQSAFNEPATPDADAETSGSSSANARNDAENETDAVGGGSGPDPSLVARMARSGGDQGSRIPDHAAGGMTSTDDRPDEGTLSPLSESTSQSVPGDRVDAAAATFGRSNAPDAEDMTDDVSPGGGPATLG
jgi:hypothetical protein